MHDVFLVHCCSHRARSSADDCAQDWIVNHDMKDSHLEKGSTMYDAMTRYRVFGGKLKHQFGRDVSVKSVNPWKMPFVLLNLYLSPLIQLWGYPSSLSYLETQANAILYWWLKRCLFGRGQALAVPRSRVSVFCLSHCTGSMQASQYRWRVPFTRI